MGRRRIKSCKAFRPPRGHTPRFSELDIDQKVKPNLAGRPMQRNIGARRTTPESHHRHDLSGAGARPPSCEGSRYGAPSGSTPDTSAVRASRASQLPGKDSPWLSSNGSSLCSFWTRRPAGAAEQPTRRSPRPVPSPPGWLVVSHTSTDVPRGIRFTMLNDAPALSARSAMRALSRRRSRRAHREKRLGERRVTRDSSATERLVSRRSSITSRTRLRV